jgi:hypothetical protein
MYKKAGVNLPRTASQQSRVGTTIGSLADAKPGDLLFFHYGHGQEYIDHVGIYIGGGKMVEAANKRAGTRTSNVSKKALVLIKRVIGGKLGGSYRSLMTALSGSGVKIIGSQANAAYESMSVDASGIHGMGAATLSSILNTVGGSSGSSGGRTSLTGGSKFAGSTNVDTTATSGPQVSGDLPKAAKGWLVNVLQKAGFQGTGLHTAYAVAMAESGGNKMSHNTNRSTGDNSYGLFQINMLGGMGPARRQQYGLASNDALFDPDTNARVAYKMSHGGSNWQPWSTYKSGSYKKFLSSGAYRVDSDQDARIHKNEMVLPAHLAEDIRSALGANRGGKNVTINLNVSLDASNDEQITKLAKRLKNVWEHESMITTVGRV